MHKTMQPAIQEEQLLTASVAEGKGQANHQFCHLITHKKPVPVQGA
jgi:hypothetical protein